MGRWAGWPKWAKWDKAGSSPPTHSITGTINDADGNGLDGVTVTLTGDASDSTTTSGGGAYEFTGLTAGSYTVTPTKAGLTFNPASAAVTITTANKTAATMASVWEITGTINDSAGAGLSGVLVTLSGDASATDTTDGSGAYNFPNLANGSYTVTPTKAGSTFSPASDAVTVNGADKVATTMAQVWEISGEVVDEDSAGVAGVTITLSGDASDSTTTNGSGEYSFGGLADGSYTVTPSKTDSVYSPSSDAATISGADEIVSDFTYYPIPYTIDFEDETLTTSPPSNAAANSGTYTVEAADADANGYTPSGFTKQVTRTGGASTDFIRYLVPAAVWDALSSGIRMEVLLKCKPAVASSAGYLGIMAIESVATRAAIWGEAFMLGYQKSDTDDVAFAADDGTTAFINSTQAVTARDLSRWMTARLEFNHGTQTATFVQNLHETGSGSGAKTASYGQAWPSASMADITSLSPYSVTNEEEACVRLWIGRLTDSWPT